MLSVLERESRVEEQQITKTRTNIMTFVKDLRGGGAERIAVNVLQGLSNEGFAQQLVLVEAQGPFLKQLPKNVRLINLAKGGRVARAIIPLALQLRRQRPDVLVAHLAHANIAALLAKQLAGVRTKVVIVEHNDNSSLDRTRMRSLPSRLLQYFKAALYRRADAVVAVSEGVSRYVEATFGVSAARVHTIYNPVVSDELITRSYLPLEHPWFKEGEPKVLLAVGRLEEQKDFSTLLRAFALLRQQRPCRLLILGEGELRGKLEAEVDALGLSGEVALPGFVENPYAYMRCASVLILSSCWEGLPTVLIEAMACGCPVVATDCPSGPREILDNGRYGPLVPVGDTSALAAAIADMLSTPTPKEVLEASTARFSYECAIRCYADLLLSHRAEPATA